MRGSGASMNFPGALFFYTKVELNYHPSSTLSNISYCFDSWLKRCRIVIVTDNCQVDILKKLCFTIAIWRDSEFYSIQLN